MIMERGQFFTNLHWVMERRKCMARDGRIAFPRLLTDDAQQKLTKPRSYIYQNGSCALAIQRKDRNHNLWIPCADFEC